jgi:hypothetical protein
MNDQSAQPVPGGHPEHCPIHSPLAGWRGASFTRQHRPQAWRQLQSEADSTGHRRRHDRSGRTGVKCGLACLTQVGQPVRYPAFGERGE